VDLSAKSEDRGVRFDVAIATGRVRAAIVKPDEARRMLQSTLAQAKPHGYVGYQFEARLALGEVEMHSGHAAEGRARLSVTRERCGSEGLWPRCSQSCRGLSGSPAYTLNTGPSREQM